MSFKKFLSPEMAVPRLRVCFYLTAAALGLTLALTHRLVVRERKDARLLAVATRVCQLSARLPVVFVHVPPVAPAVKTKPNTRRAAAAKEK